MTVDFHRFVENLTAMIEAKDAYTSGHSDRVAEFAYILAKKLGYDDSFCEKLHIGAHLHDIGKVGIPDGILLKSTKLTIQEYEVMKTHSMIGYEILKKNTGLDDIPIIIKHHHERVDGKGYPDGICGDKIPIGSRIIALADSLDAMLTNRTYREKFDFESTVDEIKRCSGTQFDNNVVESFLYMIEDDKDRLKIKKIFLLE